METAVKERLDALHQLQRETSAILKEAEKDGSLDYSLVTSIPGGREAVIARLDENLAKMTELQSKVEEVEQANERKAKMNDIESFLNAPQRDPLRTGHAAPGQTTAVSEKSLGQQFVEHPHYEQVLSKGIGQFNSKISMKALFETTSGFEPFAPRSGTIVPIVHRPIQLLDIMRQRATTYHAIVYMEQTTRTPAADMGLTEGQAFSEAALEYTERTVNVVKRGVYIPITQEQIDDVGGVMSMVNTELVDMLREDVDNQLVNGNGTAPNLVGLLSVTGRGQIARPDDQPVMSAILDGMEHVRITARSRPSHILMNSADWYDIMQLQTTSGLYLLSSGQEDVVQRLWGLPVVMVDSLPQGTAIVLDMRWVMVRDRQDVNVRMADRWASSVSSGNTAETIYTKPTGQYNLWGDIRLAQVIERPAAVCQITNL